MASWLIDGVLWMFKRPVTHKEAQEAVRNKSEIVYVVKTAKNKFVKEYTG
jgi:hypothetical protein